MTFAQAVSRVAVTGNQHDYVKLHSEALAEGRHHAGIVIVERQRGSDGEVARRLARIAVAYAADEFEDWIEYLSQWGAQAGRPQD